MHPISSYKPTNFVIVSYIHEEDKDTTDHVFSGEHGGYLYGDTWRLSTSIQSVTVDNNKVIVHTLSGSSYELDPKYIGMTGYMGSVYAGYEDKLNIIVSDEQSFDKWLEMWKNN